MINDEGQNIDLALPSTPVDILGMNNSAFAGDDFVVVDSEKKAKEINKYRIKDNKLKQTPSILANKESAFDNSDEPMIHIRFDISEFNYDTLLNVNQWILDIREGNEIVALKDLFFSPIRFQDSARALSKIINILIQ